MVFGSGAVAGEAVYGDGLIRHSAAAALNDHSATQATPTPGERLVRGVGQLVAIFTFKTTPSLHQALAVTLNGGAALHAL